MEIRPIRITQNNLQRTLILSQCVKDFEIDTFLLNNHPNINNITSGFILKQI